MRFPMQNVVGTHHCLYHFFKIESAYKTVECSVSATTADGQFQTATVHLADCFFHPRKEPHRTGMIVLIKQTSIDLTAAIGHKLIHTKELHKAFLQWESYDGDTLLLCTRRQSQLRYCTLQ